MSTVLQTNKISHICQPVSRNFYIYIYIYIYIYVYVCMEQLSSHGRDLSEISIGNFLKILHENSIVIKIR